MKKIIIIGGVASLGLILGIALRGFTDAKGLTTGTP